MSTATAAPVINNRAALFANRVSVLDATIAELKAERAIVAAQLSATLPNGKTVIDGFGSVTVSANNTYDGTAFMSLLSKGQQQRVTTRTLDRAKARAAYPALWESVVKVGQRKVSVSRNA